MAKDLICIALPRDMGEALVDLGQPIGVEQYLVAIGAVAELVVIRHHAIDVRDATDNDVRETASTADDYLVTHDKNLLEPEAFGRRVR